VREARPYSIVGRLCRQLLWRTTLGMSLLCAGIYASTSMLLNREQHEQLATKVGFIQEMMRASASRGGEAELLHKLVYYAPRRPGTYLEVWRADGSLLYRDGADIAKPGGKYWRSMEFETTLPQGVLTGRFSEDCSQYARMLAGLALTLVVATLTGAALVGFGTTWHARRGLRPLQILALQTQSIAADRLDARLQLREPVVELQPWIDQFNSLMDRLQRAYVQLEGFNADVAHELRTPLANVMGQTEVALSRERTPEALRETLTSNLEEMQRLAALVNDMLFLSQSDRGAVARRGDAVSLAALARQVVDFHEAPLAGGQRTGPPSGQRAEVAQLDGFGDGGGRSGQDLCGDAAHVEGPDRDRGRRVDGYEGDGAGGGGVGHHRHPGQANGPARAHQYLARSDGTARERQAPLHRRRGSPHQARGHANGADDQVRGLQQ